MSKGIYNTYGSRATGPSSSFPEGIFKNETSPGMENGTPLEISWAKNIEALFQKVRQEGHITNSEYVDTVVVNQTWEGLMRRLGNAPPQATPMHICGLMPEQDISDPANPPNYLNTGDTIVDSCVGYNSDTGRHYLWILHDDGSIHKIDGSGVYDSSPTLDTEVTFNWSVTPDEIAAIVSDGTFLHVAWYQTSGQVYISKFYETDFTGNIVYTWETGIVATDKRFVGMCIASDGLLGFVIESSVGVHMGSLVRNSSVIASDYFSTYRVSSVKTKIISDGNFLYCVAQDESGYPNYSYAILRCNSLSPSTQATYAINTIDITTNYQYIPVSIQRVKDLIIVSDIYGSIKALISGTVYTLFEHLPHTWYDNSAQYGISMGIDGRTLYSLMVEDDEYGSAGFFSVYKMPIDQFHSAARSSTPVALDHGRARIKQTASPFSLTGSWLLYDGIDMWLVLSTGQLFRICDTR